MKLIIGGSSGFISTEIIRQALSTPAITSIIGLARRETAIPEGATDPTRKLKSVVCDNFENYSDSVKKELEDADAVIWTIAVTPTKAKEMPWEEVVKVCKTYTVAALQTLAEVPRKQEAPLRFIYICGHFTLREKDERPKILSDNGMVEMALLRGQVEDYIVKFTEENKSSFKSVIAKPGFVKTDTKQPPPVPGLPNIHLKNISTALLKQAIFGIDRQWFTNDEMSQADDAW